jgi:hypothetical protein
MKRKLFVVGLLSLLPCASIGAPPPRSLETEITTCPGCGASNVVPWVAPTGGIQILSAPTFASGSCFVNWLNHCRMNTACVATGSLTFVNNSAASVWVQYGATPGREELGAGETETAHFPASSYVCGAVVVAVTVWSASVGGAPLMQYGPACAQCQNG